MIKKYIFPLFIILFFCSEVHAQSNDDLAIVKKRLIKLSIERQYRQEDYTTMKIDSILKLYTDGGYWSDIDYKNNIAAQWPTANHWQRLFEMTFEYEKKGSPYYKDKSLLAKIKKGIEFWVNTKLLCVNYWWNSIGIPSAMGKVLILIDQDLPADLVAQCVKVMNLGVKPDFYDFLGKATGQNLLWLTAVHMYTSCLSNDISGLKRAFNAATEEIRTSTREGIQPDYSFHQHGPQLYSFGYGRDFTSSAAQLAYLSQGTAFQLSPEKIAVISHFILDGQQWMSRGGFLEYTARGREISRGPIIIQPILNALEIMSKIDQARKSEYDIFYRQLKSGKRDAQLIGNRYFYNSDLMVNQRTNYYFSIKGASKQTISSESGNGENLKGYYQGLGTYYLVKNGTEYENVFPLLNWRQLPGSLCPQSNNELPLINFGAGARGKTDFVYGVSDGLYGCFGYDYQKDEVKAKRAWFLFDNEIVCSVAGASTSSANELYQNINQCFSKGDILVDDQPTDSKNITRQHVRSVFHDSVAYFFEPNNYQMILSNEIKRGSRHDINIMAPKDSSSGKVFSLSINMGASVKNGTLSYIMVPGISANEAKKYDLDKHVTILRNDTTIQAVYNRPLNQVQAICYTHGNIKLPWGDKMLIFEKPGLVILKNSGGRITSQLNGKLDEVAVVNGEKIIIR